MDLVTRLENFKINGDGIEEVIYLGGKEIGDVLSKGLTELANLRPSKPISYLANWLFNESKSYTIKRHINHQEEINDLLTKKKHKQEEVLRSAAKEQLALENNKNSKLNNLIEYILSATDIDIILNTVCNKLQSNIKATGVYVCCYDQQRLPVTQTSSHEAHLSSEKVIRYVYFSEDHAFLKGKHLPKFQGVTYDFFLEEDEKNQQNNQLSVESDNIHERSDEIKVRIVEEVIRETKMHFFREPQLGSYVVMNLTYMHYLLPRSLKEAVDDLRIYNAQIAEWEAKVADYDGRKSEFEELIAPAEQEEEVIPKNIKKIEHIKPSQEEIDLKMNEFHEEYQNLIAQKPVLRNYKYKLKKMGLCFDSMGQDRQFNAAELDYARKVCLTIVTAYEKLELAQLIKDRDLRYRAAELEAAYIEKVPSDNLHVLEIEYIKSYFERRYPDE